MKFRVKTKLIKTTEQILYLLIRLRLTYYRFKNRKKIKILLYTDSRGLEITTKKPKYDPFGFFTGELVKKYYVDFFLCSEKHTTITDFVCVYENSTLNYDLVITYVGIVDFSPRFQKTAKNCIYPLKNQWYDKIFGEQAMKDHLNSNFDIDYENEKTINMFSLEMAEKKLIPYLNGISNLVFIGCNHFVRGWEGNYFRERPRNIHIVEKYSKLFCTKLQNVIDISDWDDETIKRNTYDNIHLTKDGSEEIQKRILHSIENFQKKDS